MRVSECRSLLLPTSCTTLIYYISVGLLKAICGTLLPTKGNAIPIAEDCYERTHLKGVSIVLHQFSGSYHNRKLYI